MLHNCSIDVSIPIYTEWLRVKDLQLLDSALTNRLWRVSHLELLHLDHILYGTAFLRYFHCCEAKWMMKRGLKTASIYCNFEEDLDGGKFRSLSKAAKAALVARAAQTYLDLVNLNRKTLKSFVSVAGANREAFDDVRPLVLRDLAVETLRIDDGSITLAQLPQIPLYTCITNLDLTVPEIDGLFMFRLARNCPNLVELRLESQVDPDEQCSWQGFPGFPVLRHLTYSVAGMFGYAEDGLMTLLATSPCVTSFKTTFPIRRPFLGLQRLGCLEKFRAPFSDSGTLCRFLLACPALTDVVFQDSHFDGACLAVFSPRMSSLRVLYFEEECPELPLQKLLEALSSANLLEEFTIRVPEGSDVSELILTVSKAAASSLTQLEVFGSQLVCSEGALVAVVLSCRSMRFFAVPGYSGSTEELDRAIAVHPILSE